MWCVFDDLTQWQWVALAWLQLAVVYGGYLLYLALRRRRLERERAELERTGESR